MMTETPDCWERLRLALRAKGTLTDVCHALHPRSVYAVESWLSGKYKPGRASLAHIKLLCPDLASIVQECQDDLGRP
jgi:hypothetical protein